MIKGTIASFHNYFAERHKNTLLLCWGVLSCLILIIDYFTGAVIQFPFMFIIPVGLAAWYNGIWWGLLFAIVLPLIRLYFTAISPGSLDFSVSIINAVIRIVMLVSYTLLIGYIVKQKKRLEREVHILEGILPVCSFCKKIRDEQDAWQPIESYITQRSEASFSHSICPDCTEENYGEFLKRRKTTIV